MPRAAADPPVLDPGASSTEANRESLGTPTQTFAANTPYVRAHVAVSRMKPRRRRSQHAQVIAQQMLFDF